MELYEMMFSLNEMKFFWYVFDPGNKTGAPSPLGKTNFGHFKLINSSNTRPSQNR